MRDQPLRNDRRDEPREQGFSFIEIMSPCPTLYQRRNKLGDGLATMQYYKEKSVVKSDADTRTVGIGFQSEIICGKFVDRERPTWLDAYNARNAAAIGAKYRAYPWQD